MACKKETVIENVNISADRLWCAFKDGHNLFPKIAPHAVKSIENHGPSKAGSTRTIILGPDAAEKTGASYVKEKLIAIDDTAKTFCLETIEGGTLGKDFKSLKVVSKFEPKGPTTTVASLEIEYVPIGGATIEQFKTGSIALMSAVVEHLQANPAAYV